MHMWLWVLLFYSVICDSCGDEQWVVSAVRLQSGRHQSCRCPCIDPVSCYGVCRPSHVVAKSWPPWDDAVCDVGGSACCQRHRHPDRRPWDEVQRQRTRSTAGTVPRGPTWWRDDPTWIRCELGITSSCRSWSQNRNGSTKCKWNGFKVGWRNGTKICWTGRWDAWRSRRPRGSCHFYLVVASGPTRQHRSR